MPDQTSASTPIDAHESASATLVSFLDRLACVAKASTMDELAGTERTFSQMKALFALSAHSHPMSVNEIADQIHLSLAATGRTVDRLVGDGLVDRREDTHDRRVKRVSLTEDGQRFVQSQMAVKQEVVGRFVAGLPPEIRDGLRDALTPIVDADVDYFDLNNCPNTTERAGE